ncbi:MAG: hypothetical protein ABIF87_09145 [Pseudomonadota bacterium]
MECWSVEKVAGMSGGFFHSILSVTDFAIVAKATTAESVFAFPILHHSDTPQNAHIAGTLLAPFQRVQPKLPPLSVDSLLIFIIRVRFSYVKHYEAVREF